MLIDDISNLLTFLVNVKKNNYNLLTIVPYLCL